MSPFVALVLVARRRERPTAIAVPHAMPSAWQAIVAEFVGSISALSARFFHHNSGPTRPKENYW